MGDYDLFDNYEIEREIEHQEDVRNCWDNAEELYYQED